MSSPNLLPNSALASRKASSVCLSNPAVLKSPFASTDIELYKYLLIFGSESVNAPMGSVSAKSFAPDKI